MSYTVYYPGCDTVLPDHVPDICDEETEHGRVRSVAFIKKAYLATLIASPIAATWKAGIETKQIIVIASVSGTFDGGSPVESKGYGDVETKVTGYKFMLGFKDPAFKNNVGFYNALRRTKDFAVAWRTETQTQLSDNAVQVIPKTPISEELTDEVVFDVEVKFAQADLPVPFDTPAGIFEPEFQYAP